MKTEFAAVLGAVVLTLSACNSRDDADAEQDSGELAPAIPSETDTDTPEAGETTSILRPDIEQPEPTDAPLVVLEPLEVTIGFPEGGSELGEDAIGKLEDALASPQMAEGAAITLRGHSDSGGTDAANMRASRARAQSVRDWLVDNGIVQDRIEVIAFGEQNPVRPNALPDGSPNEQGRARNRRVEMTIAVEQDEEAEASDAATPPASE